MAKTVDKAVVPTTEDLRCGLVMPISSLDGCAEQHWTEVKEILIDAVKSAGFSATLVSDADDVGIIQKRIIQNLYENPIVVCDVSGKNPNVMFELGMRLAFDKPTIIVKDDKTTYSFDTSPIEHLEYPRDLRFSRIVDFKVALADKVRATHERALKDPSYTTFLKHFGKFTVAKLETAEVSKEDFVIEELRELRTLIMRREMNEREFATSKSSQRIHTQRSVRDFAKAVLRETLENRDFENKNTAIPDSETEIVSEAVEKLRREIGIPADVAEKIIRDLLYGK